MVTIERVVSEVRRFEPWFNERANDLLLRLKTESTEDVRLYHDTVSVLGGARHMLQAIASVSMKSDEPVPPMSDALPVPRARIERIVENMEDFESWFTEAADRVLMRMKTQSTEDVQIYHDAVSLFVPATTTFRATAELDVSAIAAAGD